MEPHRKLKKTCNDPGNAHYLTYSCVDRLPLLTRQTSRRWVTEAVDRARRIQRISLWAYVIMPEHVHLLVWPREERYSMGRFLAACKRPVSWKARLWLAERGEERWLERLSAVKGAKKVFRFWQPGGGFDKNLVSFYGVRAVAEYIHGNPVRRGLALRPEDWKWSSAAFWCGAKDVPLQMDPMET